MGVRNQNSSNYVHPDEPNLLNLHKSMELVDGVPHVRVTLGSDTITINGDVNLVDKVKLWDGTDNLVFDMPNNDGETAPISLPTENHNMVFNGSNWDRMRGNKDDGILAKITNFPAFPTSFELGTTTLTALETITVNQGTGGASAWKVDIGNNGTVTANVTFPDIYKVSKDTNDNSTTNRIYVDASISNSNPITVAQSDVAVTAFDEPVSVSITPVIQADAQYGLDPDFWITTKLRGGDITINAYNTWEVASGTSPGGYARLATSKYMSYQSGQGSLFRWTAAFTANGTTKDALGVDSIVQNTGPVDREDGYTFGYSGSTDTSNSNRAKKIGILHRRNGKVEIRSLTFTVGPGGNQTATITVDGTPYNVAITAGDIYHAANQVATALKAITTAANTWDIEGCNGVVTFSYYTPGARTGTFSFSSSGAGTTAVAAFSQTAAGASPSDTWTYVDQWDNQDIEFDPTKLNVYQIDMRWLGAGRVRFFMEDPATGKMVLVHTQKWTSQQLYPHINKPALRIAYRSGTTNPAITPSQNVIVRGSSVMSAVQGTRTQTGSSQGRYNINSNSKAKDLVHHLMSVQNPFVRAGGVNKASLSLQTLTIAAQGQDPSVIYVVKDAFGASDVLSYISIPNTTPAMFAQYSISAVTIDLSTQRIANVQTLGINSSATFDLAAYNLTLAPGETASVFISSSGALTRTATGLTWLVD